MQTLAQKCAVEVPNCNTSVARIHAMHFVVAPPLPALAARRSSQLLATVVCATAQTPLHRDGGDPDDRQTRVDERGIWNQ